MNRYSSLLLPVLSIVFLLASCQKESSIIGGTTPPVDESGTINNLYAGLHFIPQVFEFNAGDTQRLYSANKDTRLFFYPNSFKDKNGNIINKGKIELYLIEMYRPGAVIANRSNSASNGRVFFSAGQVYIKAFKAGEEVFPTKYSLGFGQPAMAYQPLSLLYGEHNNKDSLVTWTQSGNHLGTGVVETTLDSFISHYYFQFDSCTQFNWVNSGYFQNITTPLTGMTVETLDTVGAVINKTVFTDKNTRVFLVFPSINSVTTMNLYHADSMNHYFSKTYAVPMDMSCHIVSISLRGGEYYYAEQKFQMVKEEMMITLYPQQITRQSLLTAIAGL